jgi:tetratricopeptide (TPR) repeat protein
MDKKKRQKEVAALIVFGVLGSVALSSVVSFQSIRGGVAQRFYDWGIKYKAMGWPKGSRSAFDLVDFIAHETPLAEKARRYRDTKLPRYDVSPEAVQLNIYGYRLVHVDKNYDQAEKVFLECIRLYPHFEWPYSNLSGVYQEQKRYADAEKFGLGAININPSYVNALVGLAYTKHMQGDFPASREYINRALENDPTDQSAIDYRAWLNQEQHAATQNTSK